jgi:2,4-dienoyl-CoA reductase-like NADH-dependent reductase (Old Yellow Enzyme family)
MKIDNVDFNQEHYAGWTESDFIADQINSIPDSYGSEENKISFLKEVFKQINPAKKEVAKK